MTTTTQYTFGTVLDRPIDDAHTLVADALRAEGFGVLTEIDVRETLKRKLDVDMPPYVILGACNPSLAHRALQAEPDIGLLLPCNVVVRRDEAAGVTVVEAMDPVPMIDMTGNEALWDVAEEARSRLETALDRVAAG